MERSAKWTGQDSNPPPPRCKRGALPDELPALIRRVPCLQGEAVGPLSSRGQKNKVLSN